MYIDEIDYNKVIQKITDLENELADVRSAWASVSVRQDPYHTHKVIEKLR